jgi:hypothetical protein
LIDELCRQLPEVYVMALFASPAPFVRSFSFADGEQHLDGGSAIVVGSDAARPGCPIANEGGSEDFSWSDDQTAAFLAGGPLTLSWVTQSPPRGGTENVYVCCWITVESD